jgi:cytoskeletal protein RodZ
MDNNLNNPTPTPIPASTMASTVSSPENHSSIGGVIGTIIIIALIILGGLYFWGKRIEENKAQQTLESMDLNQTAPTNSNSEASAIESVGSTDDVTSIEADLQSTNTANLDKELQ